MRFSWDQAKATKNAAKHGVSFEIARCVFDDPLAVSVLDPRFHEERWITVGLVADRTLHVAHTYREFCNEKGEIEEEIRILSAREATARERQAYEYGL